MAASIALDKLTSAQLKDLRDQVDAALTAREAAERADIREKLTAMAGKAGFSVDDLFSSGAGTRRGRAKASKGGKVAPKYRNPSDPSQTWTGRGRMPLWLAAALKEARRTPPHLMEVEGHRYRCPNLCPRTGRPHRWCDRSVPGDALQQGEVHIG